MTELYDAFISYGRADSKVFAEKLCRYLTAQGYRIWFDFNDIPLGVDFQNQINDGIEKAHNFLYIIAPHSVNSAYCGSEVNLALLQGKRIIPLLHVEEISRETWQQRYPQGTDSQWAEYQDKGLHSSFPNMHPEIGKINWVFMREGQDNLKVSLAGLIDIFERHRDHVHNHTRLLVKALDWERQHKRSRHLLVAEERQQAEDWLLTRFKDEQPPCMPTDLHCEFITESLKNARNLMTQVFLTHAEEDNDTVEQVRRSLMRAGFTVWVSTTDIQTGVDFQTAINQGIEEADNLVYLLSPASLQSSYCRQELAYALTLNKRVIPVLVKPADGVPIPETLESLQYIDLTDNLDTKDYQKDESDLLRILRQDADYYDNHKQLLVKALKWKQQDQNGSILLRGYNLHQAEKWVQLAKQRPQNGPTPLHEEFIEASLRQPPASSLDVFVSYSRTDADFARKLNDTLQIQGKTTWFDQESIAAGSADFQQEIDRGIEVSDNFLFIISPDSVQSPYCAHEVEYAAKLNRRIVTVLYRPISTTDLHPELAKVQWLDFSQHNEAFNHQFNRLIRTLETDREHVHSHTKWSQRALEWEQKECSDDLLLRGNELAIAQEWLKKTQEQQKRPDATTLQKDLIDFSQASVDAAIQREIRQSKRLKRLLVGVSAALVVAVGASVVAFKQYQRALSNQIDALSQASQASFILNRDSFKALQQALEAGTLLQRTRWFQNDPNLQSKVMEVLAQANYWARERNRLEGHGDALLSVRFSPDGRTIASSSFDGIVKLWEQDGSLRHTLMGHNSLVNSISFSPNGTTIATASSDNTAKLWTSDGQELITLNGHQEPVRSVSFSPDGTTIATTSDDKTIKLWNQTGIELATLTGHEDRVNSVSFSPNGQTIATASFDGSVKLWSRDGKLLETFTGHQGGVFDLSFSPDGKRLATASFDQTVIIWNIPKKVRFLTLEGHQGLVTSVQFAPDGQRLATASEDETIKLWGINGQNIATLQGHQGLVKSVSFSPDGQTLASASFDKTIKLWQIDLPNLISIKNAHDGAIYGVDISSSGKWIVTASEDNTAKIWDIKGNLQKIFIGHSEKLNSVSFSPDNDLIATASKDQTVKLWDRAGQEKNTLAGHQSQVLSVHFSLDGRLIATASETGIAKIWNLDNTLIRNIKGHNDAINEITFSPDSQMVATASSDGTAKIWNLDGQENQSLMAHGSPIYRIRFSPDGQLIATAGEDNTVKLWTIEGEEIISLKSHSAGVWGLSFSPSGQMIATASDDATVKLWHLDGTLITTLNGHQGPVNGLSFSPDGTTLISVDADSQMMIWNIQNITTLDGLLVQGCSWVENYLKTNSNASRQLCDGLKAVRFP